MSSPGALVVPVGLLQRPPSPGQSSRSSEGVREPGADLLVALPLTHDTLFFFYYLRATHMVAYFNLTCVNNAPLLGL